MKGKERSGYVRLLTFRDKTVARITESLPVAVRLFAYHIEHLIGQVVACVDDQVMHEVARLEGSLTDDIIFFSRR
jgi:predicted ATP-dependent Lon-type protease